MADLVSIIVPVFNGADRLERCLNSIKNQTYSEIEVIIVDDGSTDETPAICDSFCASDSRFHVWHNNNHGVAYSRNFGLDKAKGKFIQFVDADDWIKDNCTYTLVNVFEDNVDMIVASYTKLYIGYSVYQQNLEKPGIYSSEEYLVNTLKDPGHFYYGVNWNKMYRHSVISDNNIRFDSQITLGEDFVFNLKYIEHSTNIKTISKRIYYYDCTRVSLSRGAEDGIRRTVNEFENRKIIWSNFQTVFNQVGLTPKYKKDMEMYWIRYKIRQEYHIRKFYINWPSEEIEKWRAVIDNDEVICSCLQDLSKLKYNCMKQWFFAKQTVKDFIKRVMRKMYIKFNKAGYIFNH